MRALGSRFREEPAAQVRYVLAFSAGDNANKVVHSQRQNINAKRYKRPTQERGERCRVMGTRIQVVAQVTASRNTEGMNNDKA